MPSKAWKLANADRYRKYAREYARRWRAKHPEKSRLYVRRWREKNKDAHKEYAKRHAREKAEFYCAKSARRRAQLLCAEPKWITGRMREATYFIYKGAQKLSKETGVKHHVDHIVPLKGENVCGLHVPWNLQVITASANQSKHIKHV